MENISQQCSNAVLENRSLICFVRQESDMYSIELRAMSQICIGSWILICTYVVLRAMSLTYIGSHESDMYSILEAGFWYVVLRASAGPVSSVEHPGRRFLISGGALANTPNMEGGGANPSSKTRKIREASFWSTKKNKRGRTVKYSGCKSCLPIFFLQSRRIRILPFYF
jgi:hypothetical protein